MNAMPPWRAANALSIQPSPDAGSGFSIGFDARIPLETQEELRTFVEWVEGNFDIPILLWVDFEYKHYLLTRERRRAGYLFYWSDFIGWPKFNDRDRIPIIRLPVRTEHSTLEEILFSFIQAISCYFLWISNASPSLSPDDKYAEEILHAYKNRKL